VNALAAKAPGVEVTSQAGDPGRGLVDHHPRAQDDSKAMGSRSSSSTASRSTTRRSRPATSPTPPRDQQPCGGHQPCDIESIEILKGPPRRRSTARAPRRVCADHDQEWPRGRHALLRSARRAGGTMSIEPPTAALVRRGQYGPRRRPSAASPAATRRRRAGDPSSRGTATYDHWDEAFETGTRSTTCSPSPAAMTADVLRVAGQHAAERPIVGDPRQVQPDDWSPQGDAVLRQQAARRRQHLVHGLCALVMCRRATT
jgi:hypothetical protein